MVPSSRPRVSLFVSKTSSALALNDRFPPIEASKVVIRIDSFTSTPAVSFAQIAVIAGDMLSCMSVEG
jgi:hypothetical protein